MADIKNPERRGFEPSGQDPDQGGRFAEQIRDKASQATEQTRAGVRSMGGRASRQVHDIAAKGKSQAVASIKDVATAIREAGHKLHDEDQQGAASYVDRTAGQIDRIAHYLDEHDVNELVGTVEDTARQHPALFLGAAFLAGAVLARFLRSSSEHSSWQQRGISGSRGSTSSPQGGSEPISRNLPDVQAMRTGETAGLNKPARMEDVDPTFPPASASQTPPEGSTTDLGDKPFGPAGPAGEGGERT